MLKGLSPRGYNQATNWRSFVNCAWLWYAQATGQKITTSYSSFERVRKDTCTWTRPRTCIPLSVRKATCAFFPVPAVSGRR